MDFQLTPEHEALREETRKFAEKTIKPIIDEYDRKQEFPRELFKQMGDLRMLGMVIPEQYGGDEFDYISYAIVIEELGRVDPSTALGMAAHNSLGSNHLYMFGSEELRNKYLPKLTSGEFLATWALTEPHSGSDASGLKTTAVKDGNEWVLNGTKVFATNGSYADVAVIMARTDKERKQRGVSAFVVEKGTPGFRPGKKEDKMGMRSSDTAELILEDVRIPEGNLLGELNEGFIQAMKILDGGRISIAALSLGIAQGAMDCARSHALTREAFGNKIAKFQAVQFMLADMATKIDAARMLTYQACQKKDQGEKVTKYSAMAKLFASEAANFCTDKSVQIHGGYGLCTEYPAEKFYRDVKLVEIGEGTSEVQRLVIARELLNE